MLGRYFQKEKTLFQSNTINIKNITDIPEFINNTNEDLSVLKLAISQVLA